MSGNAQWWTREDGLSTDEHVPTAAERRTVARAFARIMEQRHPGTRWIPVESGGVPLARPDEMRQEPKQ